MISGNTKIYGVIGQPISHTASPAMHNAAFEAAGLDAKYVAFEVAPELLGDAVRGMRALGLMGLNVTVPHKRAVIPLLDEIKGDALRLGVVNVIKRESGGRLTGHNTDAAGFLRSMEEGNVRFEGKRVLMFGAGGAAPAVLLALQRGGAAAVHIFNRTRKKADALAETFRATGFEVLVADFSGTEIDTLYKEATIIVNVTSLGMRQNELPPVAVEKIGPRHTVVDIIYNPWETALLAEARKRGAATANGYGMLLHQAAEAFALWTGGAAPIEAMRRAGIEFAQGRAG
jgi:shikimate dehydrogenase